MGEAFRQWAPEVISALLLVPVGLVVAAWLARLRRQRGDTTEWAWRASLAEVFLVVGTVPWLLMTLTPLPAHRSVEVLPRLDLGVRLSDPGIALVQVGGNLLVLAAFGLLAPVRWRIGLASIALLAALGSLTIETLQYVLDLGRVSSINDVLLNTAGAVLAAQCSRPWWRARRRALDVPVTAGVE